MCRIWEWGFRIDTFVCRLPKRHREDTILRRVSMLCACLEFRGSLGLGLFVSISQLCCGWGGQEPPQQLGRAFSMFRNVLARLSFPTPMQAANLQLRVMPRLSETDTSYQHVQWPSPHPKSKSWKCWLQILRKRPTFSCESYDSNIGALIIRIGFWGPLYYIYNKEPPTQYR